MFKFVVFIAIIGFCAAAPVESEAGAETKVLENEISPEGVFHYLVQTSNGIDVLSNGDAAGIISGSYKFLAPGGEKVEVNYSADENGYHPTGDWVPTPPPVPEAIVRALAYIASHPPAPEYNAKA